jgi:hypothetical protein
VSEWNTFECTSGRQQMNRKKRRRRKLPSVTKLTKFVAAFLSLKWKNIWV